MKRIGTISLNINNDDLNYGAILHSYAFQKVLDSYGVENEIIDYTTPILQGINQKYPTKGYLKNKDYFQTAMSIMRFASHARRYEKFKKFQNNNMKVSKIHYTQATLSDAVLDYDTLVCESDVIWSPIFFNGTFDPAFFLALPSMEKMKKVAYAASMGNAVLDETQEREFINLINGLDVISCRETYAADYVMRISPVCVDCVVDPVLLLEREDYESVTSSRLVDEPYVLLYFPLEYNNKRVQFVKRYAKEKKLKVVELSRYPWELLRHTTILDAGVEDFLSLIANAEVVFSNSFHAVCFSLLFEKEFYGFSRATGRKIADICKRVGLPERYITDSFVEQNLIDYQKVNQKLDVLRGKSLRFVEKNIIEI